MLSLPQRLAARIAQLDDWDDGGGIVLDHQVGAHVSSYTGSHAWNAGAGHLPPPVGPLLHRVRDELVEHFETLPPAQIAALRPRFVLKCRAFDHHPTMMALIELASVADAAAPHYATIDSSIEFDVTDDVAEHDYRSRYDD